MSAIGDIMAGLKTVVELTGKVERLELNVDKLVGQVNSIDRRLIPSRNHHRSDPLRWRDAENRARP